MTKKNRKENAHPTPPRKKLWASQVDATSSHLTIRILILKFVGHHSCPTLMARALIGVYSLSYVICSHISSKINYLLGQ